MLTGQNCWSDKCSQLTRRLLTWTNAHTVTPLSKKLANAHRYGQLTLYENVFVQCELSVRGRNVLHPRKVRERGVTKLYRNDDEVKHFCGMLDGLAFQIQDKIPPGQNPPGQNPPRGRIPRNHTRTTPSPGQNQPLYQLFLARTTCRN